MNLSKIRNFSFRAKFAIVAGLFMVFGLFGIVLIAQQQQDIRSKAAGDINGDHIGDLVGDDFRVAGKVVGNIIGNRNQVSAGVKGNIYGSANSIAVGVEGCINGDNNRVAGNVTGAVVGNNNVVSGTKGTGTCPLPGSVTPTTAITPTAPPTSTCNDGIDNNQNELIDGGDPACHTDGNQNNPGSYDPSRTEGAITPTTTQATPTTPPTPTFTPTPTPTVTPTRVPTATPTSIPGNTIVGINLLLHGIGKGGDSANPNSGGNANPRRPQRGVTVELFNSQNQLVVTKQGTITFNPAAGNFLAQVDLGNTIISGSYTVKVKTTQFLRALVPGIQTLTQGSVKQLPVTTLVNGDIETVQGFNMINILDYNILIGCYSDFLPAVDCTAANKPLADLNDDGEVNQFDYNLLLRELTNIIGQ